jgi:trans-aconitate methyltransferase
MWNPQDYAKNSDAQLKFAQELRSHLNLQGNESILDVGCGDGKITADFAATFPSSRVMGIDSSPEMIEYAQQTYPTSQYSNLSFACIDARSLSFENEFDLIFSNATLHWIDDHQTFLKGASSALRNSGKLITSCGGQGNAADILQVFVELTASPPWNIYFEDFETPYYFYGFEDYQLWLQQSGLKAKRLELVPKDMTHQGKEGLTGWIRTTWMPFNQRIPQHQQETFIEQVVNSYLAKIPLDSDGLTHVRMVRLEVEAYN